MIPTIISSLFVFHGTKSELNSSNTFPFISYIDVFDIPVIVTNLNQEKRIDSEYIKSMTKLALFLDQLHFKNKNGNSIGNKNASVNSTYNHVLNAQSKSNVEKLRK